MNKDDLINKHPHLWHMAEQGSWPFISKHGLLSTSSLLDLYKVEGEERKALESMRRPDSVTVSSEGLPNAVIRDQKPMSDNALKKCLQDDMTPSDWYSILNARTFFWLSRVRLRKLLKAKAYRDKTQTVLTLDSKSLIDAYESTIELSPINSGSTIYTPAARGKETFLSIDDWIAHHPASKKVAELVVMGGVPDVSKHVLVVHEWMDGKTTELWRKPGFERVS